jgi:hypothetical protein
MRLHPPLFAALSLLLGALLPHPLAGQAPQILPAPREIVRHAAPVRLRGEVTVQPGSEAADREAALDFATAMRERGLTASVTNRDRGWHVTLLRDGSDAARRVLSDARVSFDSTMADEGYVLVASAEGATVIGRTAAGVFYGLQSLKQLVSGGGERTSIQPAVIRDWPAMRWRGVQDDLSRGPVPTLEYQKRQVRLLAAFKINTLSLYFEHTLAFASQPVIAPPGGAMSREDVRALVAYATKYHVTIIPQQQTFGHLHHALKLELYADLAETVHGHVLAPGQRGSLEFTRGIFAEIDSLFSSPFVHLGADETFELGKGRTKPDVDARGIGPVYVDYLREIVNTVRQPGKRYLFWGDIAMNHPEQVRGLPQDLIAVGWDYGSRTNFDRYLKPFRDAGMETWVAPGVSSWNRVYPNFAVALPNIQGFIRDGQRFGATGVLNTTWDDDGDAIFETTWYGIVYGAAASWQPGETSIPDFQSAYGRAFHGDTTGAVDAAQRHLMLAQEALQASRAGDASTFLFYLDPWSREGGIETIRLRPHLSKVRIHAESALVHLAKARTQRHILETTALDAIELGARRIDWLAMKFQIADEVAQLLVGLQTPGMTITWKELAEITGINGKLQDMRDGYVLTRELFERSYRAENRPYWMHNVLARHDEQIQNWVRRISTMDAARRRFTRDRTVPTPEELGVPSTWAPPAPTGGR